MSDDTTSLFAAVPQVPGRCALRESSASFLARGGRRECIGIREWLEGAYARVPLARRRDVWNRIHSHRGFLGAYFELRMHALLDAIGCEVAWEPAIGGAYVPDFAAAHATGGFIMEATVCGQFNADDHANEERAVAAIRSRVREVIGPTHSDLVLRADGHLTDTLATKKVAAPFVEMFRDTSAESVAMAAERGAPETRTYSHKNKGGGTWTLRGALHPWPAGRRPSHLVSGVERSWIGDGAERSAKALDKKAKEWRSGRGGHPGPFFIALGEGDWRIIGDDSGRRRAIERDDGAWRNELRDVAGVLFVDLPWLGNEARATVHLYANPAHRTPPALEPLLHRRELAPLIGFPP